MELTPEKLDEILDEIAGFEVHLVDDPTLPQYGPRYLQKCVSDCRNYTNRVQYYLQICKKQEKVLRRNLSLAEVDFDIKFKNLISEDPVVRRESSYGDRQARASSMLRDEAKEIGDMKTQLQDLDETIKILKMKYGDLKATNSDIKLQRQLVRDEITDNPGGGGESKGRSYGSGLGPTADREPVDPSDLFDDNKRPEDLPKPRDGAHARQIATFYNNRIGQPKKQEECETPKSEPEESPEEKKVTGGVDYDELLG